MTSNWQPPPRSLLPSGSYLLTIPAAYLYRCPKPPPASFDDEDWDDINWDDEELNCSFSPTQPQTPKPIQLEPGPEAELTPVPGHYLNEDYGPNDGEKPRTVSEEFSAKLKQDSPRGVQSIFTPGNDLLCGLHAARLSMLYQPDFQCIRQPSLKDLMSIWEDFQKDAPEGNENTNYFEATQLARITQTYLGREGIASRLGVVSPSMGQKMFPVIYSDMEEYKNAEKVLWVYNDAKGTHWEAMRSAELDRSVDMDRYWEALLGDASSNAETPSQKSQTPEKSFTSTVPQPRSLSASSPRISFATAAEDQEDATQPAQIVLEPVPSKLDLSTTRLDAPYGLLWPIAAQIGPPSTTLTTTRPKTKIHRKTLSDGATGNSRGTPITLSSLLGMRLGSVG